jgi:hypothetical protein
VNDLDTFDPSSNLNVPALARGTWKRSETDRVSERGDAPVAAPASATQPTEPLDLGTLPGKLRIGDLLPEITNLHPYP